MVIKLFKYYFRTSSFDDLQYLTLEQSISDIATFIHTARQHIGNPNAKIILWGSGYGGTLATYTRQKYPHLVDVAWSSSGIYIPFVYTQCIHNIDNKLKIYINL